MTILKTHRLILRPWESGDFVFFERLNRDPRVMEFFPATLTKEESDKLANRIQSKIEKKGWGFWAVSLVDSPEFIGFIGLNYLDHATFPTHFTPAVEIGWRIAFEYWGKGYATEGALAALQYGFENLHLEEIVAFTAVQNIRSRHVMEKIGMHRDPKDDFECPKSSEGYLLKQQVLYRLSKIQWDKSHKI
jgi:3-dehydroquinate dehydratase/shikimate dehydrogenase